MTELQKNPHDVRVVVTGLGIVSPIALNVADYWQNLQKGVSGVRRLRNIDAEGFSVQIGGEIDLPEDLTAYGLGRKAVRRYDRYIILAHIAATQAFLDAGIQVERAPHRYGALIGTGEGGLSAHEQSAWKIHERGMDASPPLYVVNAIPSSGTGYFAKERNLQGPNFSVNSACASSNHAISLAVMLIKMGMADAMFAGGSEAVVNTLGVGAFAAITALSERNDSPETASRPFDKDRDGFVLSEGAAVLCLEELEHAKRRGARIYAEISGVGLTCDAHDLVAPEPEGNGAAQAMRSALAAARLEPAEIDLVSAHATSTPLGDLAESRAIHQVFKERGSSVPVQATKSILGHMVGAASAAEAIAVIPALQEGVIHPTINQFEQDPLVELNVIGELREMPVRRVLSNSFGFAGLNAAVVFSRFEG